jgi:type IV pilus assembly protein PilY1
VTTTPYSGGTFNPNSVTVVTSTSAPANVDGVCYTPGVNPAPALPSPGKPGTSFLNGANQNITLQPAPTAPCLAWPCTVTDVLGGSIGNTLADVAQYYYVTDLRPSIVDDVKPSGSGPEDDRVRHQHMTTFAIGLGVSGELAYRPDYRSETVLTGDFADIRRETKAWPQPVADQPSSIDDFWHAAVNGRGLYISAGNPQSVIDGLRNILEKVDAAQGSGSAAAASSAGDVVSGSVAYQASYLTQAWSGDLQAKQRDPSSGVLAASANWSASTLLDAKVGSACDNRKIYVFRNSTATKLAPFTWNTSACDSSGNPTGGTVTDLNATEQAYFDSSEVSALSQHPLMTDGTGATVNQRTAAAGANLLNFIRGHRGREGFEPNVLSKLFRTRKSVLGDIVNSQPYYVKNDVAAEYDDTGFAEFNANMESRIGMVYVGSNGGMLHAIRAGEGASDVDGGKEQWSFVPTAVMPNLYRLADTNYAGNHIYTVDGSPNVFSASITNPPSSANDWRTVLVAGLRGGGKGYYALDVTDPVNPKALWEFSWGPTCITGIPGATVRTDCHLGYTYGTPKFGKLADGTWVVFLSSGYNNVNSPTKAGDGFGYLYVLNAFTGQVLNKISTGAGNATSPSGLAPISAYADDPERNALVVYVYGGDLEGNVWRFDATSNFAATLVGKTSDGSAAQPITTVMPVRETNGKVQVVVGTGKLLGIGDIPSNQVQSVYSIVDEGAIPDLRATLTKINLTASGVAPARTVTAVCNATGPNACEARKGWYADFPGVGERVVVDMKLVGTTLVATTSILDNNPCNAGGSTQLYIFNVLNGLAPSVPRDAPPGTNSIVSSTSSLGLPVGTSTTRVANSDGTTSVVPIGTLSTGDEFRGSPINTAQKPIGNRVTWREILQ